jgi:uncharacterized membrane protein
MACATQEVTMADQGVSTALKPGSGGAAKDQPIARAIAVRVGIGFIAVVGFVALALGSRGLSFVAQALGHAHLHTPDWPLLAAQPLAIRIHLATVSMAVVLATVQVLGPKGRTFHRTLGWILAGVLIVTAVAALFIRNPGGGLFNPFQIFSVWTLIAIPWGIVAARGHNVRRHAGLMMGFYFGGMILAGTLAFLPGRLMWRVFFG